MRSPWLGVALLVACGSAPAGSPDAGLPDAGLRPLPPEKPLVWFSPLKQQTEDVPGSTSLVGTVDFMDLFQAAAPWTQAAAHVQILKVNCGTIERYLSDDQLHQIISDVERRGMFLAVEGGPLIATPMSCGDGIEGFVQDESLDCLTRIQRSGGHTRIFDMDEPVAGAVFYTGPNDCHWSMAQVAGALKVFADRARAIEPGMIVSDIEPLRPDQPVSAYTEFLDAYEAASGAKLSIFNLDIDYSLPDWAQRAHALEQAVRARGVDFGVIYDGHFDDHSDAAWTQHAAETFAVLEGQLGGHPDDVDFQSWNEQPAHNLPEDQADTFTHLIDRYFGMRTTLAVSLGATAAQGTLAGGPPGAAVTLTVTPLDGPGDVGDLAVSGSVPADARATMALLQLDCGTCTGAVTIDLYRASFVAGGGPNLVPDADFSGGLSPWYFGGAGAATVVPSDQGSGSMLHIAASAGQTFILNSGSFAVTPGASFVADVTLRVPPAYASGGFLTAIFLDGDGKEVTRSSRSLATTTRALQVTTDAGGAFEAALPAATGSRRRVDAGYAGDPQRWPAFASASSP